MASTHRLGSPTSCTASLIIPPRSCTNCSPGTGSIAISQPLPPDNHPLRPSPDGYSEGAVIADAKLRTFYGWRVVSAAFVLAVFGWGIGFYGPPVFLSVLHETRGWPLALLSTAVTVHFLTGAVVGANLPALYRRFCPPTVTKTGALCLAVGVLGWSPAAGPGQL